MNITHVISSLNPKWGGPPAVVARLAAGQAALGESVQIVSHTDAESLTCRLVDQGIPGGERVAIQLVPNARPLDLLMPRRLGLRLAERLAQVDVIHLHGLWDPILLSAALTARRCRIPYVLTCHGMLDGWSLSQRAWKKKTALFLGFRHMLARAAFLHVLNQDELSYVERLRLGCPLETIPNGVFLEEIGELPPPGSFYAMCPELRGRPFVLFLGRLHFKKGLDYLAQAFSQLAGAHPDLQLVVAGPDDGGRGLLERIVADANLGNRVHLVGPIYGREKYKALVDAICFCLPSRQEGFSVAITEALACATPVVISESCHFPEVAECGAGEVVALDPSAVASALDKVVTNSDLRARMSSAGRRLVKTRFTWPKIAEEMIATYCKRCWHAGSEITIDGRRTTSVRLTTNCPPAA